MPALKINPKTSSVCDRAAPNHLIDRLINVLKVSRTKNLGAARSVFESAVRNQWVYPPEYEMVRDRIENILQRKRPGSDLFVLDDEFSPASRQWREFAIMEYLSGNTLINTTVKHPNDVDHDQGDNFLMGYLSQAKARSVFASSRRSHISHMNMHEIASALRRAGTGPDRNAMITRV
ncbi:hypothetical protein V8C37DRAFT_375358 [Trichoderma ceciliae]